MSGTFTDKVGLVTGASSGIGRATAVRLAALGARLALTGRRPDALEETNRLCGGGHLLGLFDVGDAARTRAFLKEVSAVFGGIDHVFNNAGQNPTECRIEDLSDEYWENMVNTNLTGLFNVTKASLPYLRPGASFVNHSSISGIRPAPLISVYCATKYACIGFSLSMALELGPRGIRTNVVAPGYVSTPTNISVLKGEEAMNAAASEVALGRMGTAEEVASTVIYLFSEEARYINGSVIEVNGGVR
ncbi:hypothetical protein PG989_012023 [Apiospora arundinis]